MNILINITKNSELITYEACALGLLLASFDHQVHFLLQKEAVVVLGNPYTRLHGMIKSAPLYDIAAVWVSTEDVTLLHDDALKAVIHPIEDITEVLTRQFDSLLTF
ncbi:MAG: hypothetical protein Q4C68_03545 [Moraxella sp.]|nr:hypothetical protein [Moraxella sp.]